MSQNPVSDDEANSNKSGSGKRIRGAPTRNGREKELRDAEQQKEKQRIDSNARRKGRSERRRGEGDTSFTMD